MTGLRNRVELGTRSLPDLALVACLGLLWVAGSVPLWSRSHCQQHRER